MPTMTMTREQLSALAAERLTAVEEAFAAHRQHAAPAMSRIQCVAGCEYCCHISVGVTAAEASLIAGHLAGQSRLKRDAVLRGLKRVAGVATGARLAKRIACPFLAKKSCSIYAIRPFACRGWNSADAEACRRMLETADQGFPVPVYRPQRELFAGAAAALADRLGAGASGELCAMVLKALG